MAYLKNWTDNFFQIFVMGTSWVAVSINNITTRASREMTSRKNIKMFDFNGMNVAKHWHVAGEVFAISDCLVLSKLCYKIGLRTHTHARVHLTTRQSEMENTSPRHMPVLFIFFRDVISLLARVFIRVFLIL